MFFNLMADSPVSPQVFCGLLAGVLAVVAYAPYLIDTAKGRTRPERATWLIWSVVASIAMGSQIYEGADKSLMFVGVKVSGTIIVFLMSIRLGAGVYLSRRNINLFGLTAVGVVIWYWAEDALFMLLITTGISILGGSVTVLKAYRDPESETLKTWVISLVASFFAIVSVGKLDIALLIYPVYLYLLYTSIVLATLLGRLHGNAQQPVAAAPTEDMQPVLTLAPPTPPSVGIAPAGVVVDVRQVN